MRKSARRNIRHSYILLLLFVLLACNNPSWAGVAAYQLDGGTTLPAPISYWLSGDATSVTIDVIDAVTSAVIFTFPTITGANATRGFHSNVVTWDSEANGGGAAPPGSYKLRATVRSDMSGTDLKPLWESCSPDGDDSRGWVIYGIGMNNNPNSPFYGRVYVGNYQPPVDPTRKAVWEFNPDGTEIGKLPLPPGGAPPWPYGGFGPSGPWGLCVDADDHVYVSNRSYASSGGAGPAVWRYHWDGSQWICSPKIGGLQSDRYLGCNFASGSALRLVDTYFPSNGSGVISRMYPGFGDPPATFSSSGDKTTGDCFMQPAIDASGTVFVAGINWPNLIGCLTQWDLSGNPVNDPNNPGPVKNRNAELTQATGLAITTDDTTLWMARQAAQAAYADIETSPFYKFPKSMAMTITRDNITNLKKYGWGTIYNHATTHQYPRFIAVDGQSNLAVAGVDSAITNPGSVFGLYAEPTGSNTSEVRVGRNIIVKENFASAVTGTITEGSSGRLAAGVTVRATKGDYYREAVTNAAGVYLIDVLPDTGYTVAPVTNIYGNTLPIEYNLQSDWPSDPGATDWPQIANTTPGGTTTVNGRVWPLAVTQATYDWAAALYRSGGRTVCVTGTVLRQAADSTVTPNQKGYNGYYFVADMLGAPTHDTQQAVKVKVFLKGSECKKGDKVVVVGTFDPPPNYNQGVITPTSAPTVLSSGNLFPEPQDATNLTSRTLDTNLIGGWYVMWNKTVSRVGTSGEFYVEVPYSSIDPTLVEFRIDMDTMATTGIGYPTVGQGIDIYGVLDELAPSNGLRALRPGAPGDAGLQGLVADIAGAKAKSDGADVALASAQVTAIAGGGVPADTAYIEQPNRIAGLRVHVPGLGSDIGPGDLVVIQGQMGTTADGERFIEATKFTRILGAASARPVDPIGMNNRDAASDKARGMLVKTWGVVGTVNPDSFVISDGSPAPIKVLCGSLAKPDSGRLVRVRGITSVDPFGIVLYMRNEQVDWQYGEETYQPIPFPGAYKYPRDFLVAGPFADANSVDQSYRLDHDFIYDATGGSSAEWSVMPSLGGSVGTKTWLRSQATGDNANFAAVFPTGNTNCTFYAHIWLYSPEERSIGVRVGSCDSAKVFMNGTQVYATSPLAVRAEMQGQDPVYNCSVFPGFNSVLLKVEHGTTNTPGIDIQFVDSDVMGGPGWGNAIPLQGYGYLLTAPP